VCTYKNSSAVSSPSSDGTGPVIALSPKSLRSPPHRHTQHLHTYHYSLPQRKHSPPLNIHEPACPLSKPNGHTPHLYLSDGEGGLHVQVQQRGQQAHLSGDRAAQTLAEKIPATTPTAAVLSAYSYRVGGRAPCAELPSRHSLCRTRAFLIEIATPQSTGTGGGGPRTTRYRWQRCPYSPCTVG